MIRRENDPAIINRIANDGAVRPFIRPGGEPMDFASIVSLRPTQSGCVILSNGEDAIGLFDVTGDQQFQGHTLFGPTCRGKRAVETGRAMLGWMFEHGAKMIWGVTPLDNRKPAGLIDSSACVFSAATKIASGSRSAPLLIQANRPAP